MREQVYDRLKGMLCFGESKRVAMKDGSSKDKIFAINTFHTYKNECYRFADWVKEKYGEMTMKKAEKYVNEYLQQRQSENPSAWTMQTTAKALGKFYGIEQTDYTYYNPPKRERKNIVRSRLTTERDAHFSESNNQELIAFCRGTGLRHRELAAILKEDLYTKQEIEELIETLKDKERNTADEAILIAALDTRIFDATHFIYVRKGKGGRKRFSPIIGENQKSIIARFHKTQPGKHVWEYVNSNADIHAYRGDYATAIYKANARDIKDIPFDGISKGTGRAYQKDVYVCRKDEKGKKLDRKAMIMCSKALGHNRQEIVANNYIRGI